MRRILPVLLLLLAGLTLGGDDRLEEWEDLGLPRCSAVRVPCVPGREALPPPDTTAPARPATADQRISADAAAPRSAPATRLLIHRYNE